MDGGAQFWMEEHSFGWRSKVLDGGARFPAPGSAASAEAVAPVAAAHSRFIRRRRGSLGGREPGRHRSRARKVRRSAKTARERENCAGARRPPLGGEGAAENGRESRGQGAELSIGVVEVVRLAADAHYARPVSSG